MSTLQLMSQQTRLDKSQCRLGLRCADCIRTQNGRLVCELLKIEAR